MNVSKDTLVIELQQNPKLLKKLVKYIERLEILKERSKEYANTEEGREYYRQKASKYYEKNKDLILQKAKERYEKKKEHIKEQYQKNKEHIKEQYQKNKENKVSKVLTEEELLLKRQKNNEYQRRRREKLRQKEFLKIFPA